jgi:hypothetical protein
MKIASNKYDFRIFFTLSTICEEYRFPEGAPPRRINNLEHFGKHGTAPPCPRGALMRGVLISAISWFGCELFVHARFYRA